MLFTRQEVAFSKSLYCSNWHRCWRGRRVSGFFFSSLLTWPHTQLAIPPWILDSRKSCIWTCYEGFYNQVVLTTFVWPVCPLVSDPLCFDGGNPSSRATVCFVPVNCWHFFLLLRFFCLHPPNHASAAAKLWNTQNRSHRSWLPVQRRQMQPLPRWHMPDRAWVRPGQPTHRSCICLPMTITLCF